jgi:membrane protein required for colicin V production
VNLLDFAVLAFILLLAVRGYFRGFFRELFGLAAWLGAGIVAYLFGPVYGPAVSARFQLPPAIGQMLAALALFVALYLLLQLAGWILHSVARAIFLGPVDRAGGLVFGTAKAIAIGALFCMLVTSRRGMPDLAERVHASPMLSALVDEGWDVFAIVREHVRVEKGWQRPYSKMELEAREALNHFLTPKPSPTATPSPSVTPRAGAPG